MSLIKYGIAAAVGYHLGQPQGRKQLEQLRRQVVQLGKRPEVKQWQERGRDIAYERALAAKSLASTTLARKKTVDPAPGAITSVVDSTDPVPGPASGGSRRRASGWRKPRPAPADPAAPLSAPQTAGAASAADRVRWSDRGGGLRGRPHRGGPRHPPSDDHAPAPAGQP